VRLERAIAVGLSGSLSVACGAAPTPLAAPHVAPRCAIGGLADQLLVGVEGLPDVLYLVGLEATVDLDGAMVTVRVPRPLRFSGTAPLSAVRAMVAEPRTGPIALFLGAEVADPSSSAGGVRAAFLLEGAPLSERDEEGWTGVLVQAEIPCSSVRLGTSDREPAEPDEEPPTHALTGTQDVVLLDGPAGEVLGVLSLHAEPEDALRLVRVVERTGEHAHVRRRYAWGAIDAWVSSARLEPTEAGWSPASAFGGISSRGCGGSARHAYVYRGRARIRRGTPVHAEPSMQVWAEVAEDFETRVAMRDTGETELLEATGLQSGECATLERDLAIVPSTAVTPLE
jgi:hypothetical protein